MALQRYTKQHSSTPHIIRKKLVYDRQVRKEERRFTMLHRIAPFFLMGVGVFLLANVIGPLVSYQFFSSPTLQANATDQPVVEQVAPKLITREYLFPTPKPTPVVVAEELDYTDLSNWFPEHNLPILPATEAKSYHISIPTVGVEDAEVLVGGKDLDKSLIQYPGTALPGEYGSPVIFGHSVLRQFYNPSIKNPRRYISIFSKIMTLKEGDLIIVKDDGVTYRYKVASKTEVKPEDMFILQQNRDARTLKLVTCVPEGTYLRRGVITAVLEEVDQR